MTLTINEIYDLAFLAGILAAPLTRPDSDDGALEITVGECPEEGIRTERNHIPTRYRMIAWYKDYPFEGSLGLGAPTGLGVNSHQPAG